MELQNDLESPQGLDDVKMPHSFWNFKLAWGLHKVKMISKFPPPWNFKLTWGLHKVKMISKFLPSWNFNLTWSLHKVKMISKFPLPWNFKLTWSLHRVKMISKFPPPWNFKLTVESPQRLRPYQNSNPMELRTVGVLESPQS